MRSALLLAAGKSSRMGTLKAMLHWGNRTLIEQQIMEISQSCADELVIVTGYEERQITPLIEKVMEKLAEKIKITIIYNEHFESGKSSSIRLGMSIVSERSSSVIIIGVDQPVRWETLNELYANLHENKIVLPVYSGKKGHPPGFTSPFFEDVKKIREETEGLREVVRNHWEKVVKVCVNEQQVLLNLNRYEDYLVAKEKKLDNYEPRP